MNYHRFVLGLPLELVCGRQLITQIRAIQGRQERIRFGMTSHGRSKSKRNEASEVGASPIQFHGEDTSANHTPFCEDIRLRAYEIYLERGNFSGNELDDWLQAERELGGRTPREGESTTQKDIDHEQPVNVDEG